MAPDVNTRIYDLPESVKGFTRHNDDDIYTAVLNSKLDQFDMKKPFFTKWSISIMEILNWVRQNSRSAKDCMRLV